MDRLSHYRSEIRSAAATHIAEYRLGVGELCQQRVAALLKGNYFVYDGHWATGVDEVCAYRLLAFYLPASCFLLTVIPFQDKWVIKSQTTYLNPAIINTIKSGWFSSDKTLGNQFQKVYVSTLSDHPDEKEFPIPLIALAVTSVRLSFVLFLYCDGFMC